MPSSPIRFTLGVAGPAVMSTGYSFFRVPHRPDYSLLLVLHQAGAQRERRKPLLRGAFNVVVMCLLVYVNLDAFPLSRRPPAPIRTTNSNHGSAESKGVVLIDFPGAIYPADSHTLPCTLTERHRWHAPWRPRGRPAPTGSSPSRRPCRRQPRRPAAAFAVRTSTAAAAGSSPRRRPAA